MAATTDQTVIQKIPALTYSDPSGDCGALSVEIWNEAGSSKVSPAYLTLTTNLGQHQLTLKSTSSTPVSSKHTVRAYL
jgi:hypothetical protein